jgi:hypothetical protein
MNPASAMELKLTSPLGLDSLLGFVGLPSARTSSKQELTAKTEEVLRATTAVVDGLLLRAIEAKTKREFNDLKVFGRYAQLVTWLTRFVNVMVSPQVIEVLSAQSFSELESDFRDQGLTRFGIAARDQAMFTIWTMRRTNNLLSKIHSAGAPPAALLGQDAEIASEFTACAAWTAFNLDCLLAAIRFDKPIQPDVLTEIQEGLLAAVNAYGLARRGLDLRSTHIEPTIVNAPWDEEDQELLDSSMLDLEVEAL